MTLPWFSPFFLADVTPNISRMRATEKEEEKLTVDYLWQTPPIQIFYWNFSFINKGHDQFYENCSFHSVVEFSNMTDSGQTIILIIFINDATKVPQNWLLEEEKKMKNFSQKKSFGQAKCRIPNGEKYKKKPFLWWKCPRIVSLSSAGGAIFGGRPRSDSELPKLSLRRFDHNSKVEEAMQNYV